MIVFCPAPIRRRKIIAAVAAPCLEVENRVRLLVILEAYESGTIANLGCGA